MVLTEAATGAYHYSPVMVALAGSQRVYAVAADSQYGSKEDVRSQTLDTARRWDVQDRIEVVFAKTRECVAECDIATNSGFVRPIDREFVSWMKPTAVIPLMWETWELRDYHLDLQACKDFGILTLGTDEAQPPHALYDLPGYLAMKLLFELGLEGYRTNVLLLGSNVLARCIHAHFARLGLPTTWFGEGEADATSYERLHDHFTEHGGQYDLVLVAEHDRDVLLLGQGGLLSYELIEDLNPTVRVGVVSGNVDSDGLRSSRLTFQPQVIQPFGRMSYPTYELGPLPVLELYAAGLKVGEAMARARLSGKGVADSARHALEHSPAMDFPGGDAWLNA